MTSLRKVNNANVMKKSNWSGKFKNEFKKSIPIYTLLLPGVLLLLVFHYLPIFGILIAFKDFSPFKGVMGSDWVGIKYFVQFLSDSNFWRVMKNTILINIFQVVFGFPVPIIFALLLNELWGNGLKKIVQTISYLPHFISWVVVAGMITAILSPSTGLINKVLNYFGIESVYFLAQSKFFVPIIVVSAIWKNFGMSAVYYIAALSSIDPQQYEAAAIDGAGKWKQTLHVTLPGILNMAIVLLVLQLGRMLTIGFEQIFLLYNPMVYDVGDVISTYTYRLGIEQTQYSLTAAIGFTQSIVNFILVYSANKLSKKVAGWSLW